MLRRMMAVMFLVLSLSLVLVAPAAAQNGNTEYAIRNVSLISEGEERSFYRIETYERGLSNDQADQLCIDLGFDEAIGIDRERYSGDGYPKAKYDVVTCAGEANTATAQAGAILVFQGIPTLPIDALIEVYVASDLDQTGPNGTCAGQFVADDLSSILAPATFELEVGTTYCFLAINQTGIAVDDTVIDRLTVSANEEDNFLLIPFTIDLGGIDL